MGDVKVGGVLVVEVWSGNDGEWIAGFAKRLRMCSAYMAELWDVYVGLLYSRWLWFSRVEVNVDYSVVVDMLMKGGSDSRGEGGR
jgi:hypothetical protein